MISVGLVNKFNTNDLNRFSTKDFLFFFFFLFVWKNQTGFTGGKYLNRFDTQDINRLSTKDFNDLIRRLSTGLAQNLSSCLTQKISKDLIWVLKMLTGLAREISTLPVWWKRSAGLAGKIPRGLIQKISSRSIRKLPAGLVEKMCHISRFDPQTKA